MAFRAITPIAKSATVTAASGSAPKQKPAATGKLLRRKEGWSTAEVVAAGLATEEQKAAAQQLSRGGSYGGAGDFALDDGWSVQVVTEPKQAVDQATKGNIAVPSGGKSARQKGKVDPQSDAGSKALAGLAEFMKAKEEEARRQKEAEAAAAAQAPQATALSKKKKKKQKAPSLFGDLPEFDSAYRKFSKDNLKGDVVARLPGIDPTTGEFVPMPDQQYGLVDGYGEESTSRRRVTAGKDRRRSRGSAELTMEDLLRQQRGEDLDEDDNDEEEEVDVSSRSSLSAAEEEVTLEDLRELLSMEDSEVLAGLQDLMPDDEDLMAMLQPMLPSTPEPTTPTRAARLGSYKKDTDGSAASNAEAVKSSSKEEDNSAIDALDEEGDVGAASMGPMSIRVRPRRKRGAVPNAPRIRRQFQAEVVEEIVIEEEEGAADDGQELLQEDSSTSSSAVGSTETSKLPQDIHSSAASNISKASTDNVLAAAATTQPAAVAGDAAEKSSIQSLPTQDVPAASTSGLKSNDTPNVGLSPAAMLRQMEAGTLDESQLTPLARKLLQYQQQYKQVQEREKQRRAAQQLIAEQQRQAREAQNVTTSSGTVNSTAAAAQSEAGEVSLPASSSTSPAETQEVARRSTQEEEEAKLEAQLSQYFSPRKVKKLMQEQRAVDKHNSAIAERSSPEWRANRTLHQKLKIVGGKCQSRRIWSSRGPQTRPMMERVRHAVFNMLHSFTGMLDSFDPNMRCLDLFAGTGSVGIEAVSRGCSECHFVEMDPWVVKNVTRKNVDICGLSSQAVFHTAKVEDFMEKAIQLPKSYRAFDIISMCPPYLLVSYPQLFDLLERSPFLHEYTFVIVEYPRQLKHEIPEDLGPLTTLRDREYGRTWIRIYGPSFEDEDDE